MEVVVTAKGRIMSNVHPGGLSLSIWGGRKPLPRCLGKKPPQGIMRGDGNLSIGVFLGPRGPLGLPSLVRPSVRPSARKIWISCIAL